MNGPVHVHRYCGDIAKRKTCGICNRAKAEHVIYEGRRGYLLSNPTYFCEPCLELTLKLARMEKGELG